MLRNPNRTIHPVVCCCLTCVIPEAFLLSTIALIGPVGTTRLLLNRMIPDGNLIPEPEGGQLDHELDPERLRLTDRPLTLSTILGERHSLCGKIEYIEVTLHLQ
jgi:hypothetical protein